MTVLTVIVCAFLVLELSNVAALYFRPGSARFNALGVFKAFETSKDNADVHDLVRYLAYWVAGVKLIFILLLGAILVVGDDRMKVVATGAVLVSVLSFFWRLFPLSRALDRRGQLSPAGYSKTLASLIVGFVVALSVALASGVLALGASG